MLFVFDMYLAAEALCLTLDYDQGKLKLSD